MENDTTCERFPHGRVLSGHQACSEALRSERLVSDPYLVKRAPAPSSNLLTMDGVAHAELRALVNRFITKQGGLTLRAAMRERVSGYLPTTTEPFDVLEQLAKPLIADFLSLVFGYGEAERCLIDPYLEGLDGILENRDHGGPQRVLGSNTSVLRMWSSLNRCLRRAEPGSIFAFMNGEVSNGVLSHRESIETCLVLIHGAYENPLNHLGCIAAFAAQDFAEFQRIAEQSGCRKLVADIADRSSPVSKLLRYDQESDGEHVWIQLETPDDVVSARQPLAFGYGRHRCPGQGLAYDLGTVFAELLRAIPEEHWHAARVEWRQSDIVNGPALVQLNDPGSALRAG